MGFQFTLANQPTRPQCWIANYDEGYSSFYIVDDSLCYCTSLTWHVLYIFDRTHDCSKNNRPISQILKYIRQISQNAPFCDRKVQTCAHFCYIMVQYRLWDRCIVGCGERIYYSEMFDLREEFGFYGLIILTPMYYTRDWAVDRSLPGNCNDTS